MAVVSDYIRMDADTMALGVTIFGMDDDDDEDEAMNPEYDEFDAWERTVSTVTRNCAKGETVTTLQKLFLEELNSGGDTNDAAARALKRLAALAEQHEQTRSVENECGTVAKNISAQLAPVSSSTKETPPAVPAADTAKRQQALLALRKLFLQELNAGGDDASGAAAIAVRRLAKPDVQAVKVCKRQEALLALQRLEEMNAGGDDASGAAAIALRRLVKSGC